jgi:hypothetical protein
MKCILMHCFVAGSYSPTFNNPISGDLAKIKEAIELWEPEYILWIL